MGLCSFSRNHSTVAAARERLGDATAMAHQINGVPSASGSVVELTSIAASQWIQAGNSFLIAHDGASAARWVAPLPDVRTRARLKGTTLT